MRGLRFLLVHISLWSSGVLAHYNDEHGSVVSQLIARTLTTDHACRANAQGAEHKALVQPRESREHAQHESQNTKGETHSGINHSSNPGGAKPVLAVKPDDHGEPHPEHQHKHKHSSEEKPTKPKKMKKVKTPKHSASKAPSQEAPIVSKPTPETPAEKQKTIPVAAHDVKPAPVGNERPHVKSTPTTAITPPSQTQPAPVTDPFISDVLQAHNMYRWIHGEQALQWNTTLQAYAHDWGSKCIWEHSQGNYGENLAEGYPNWAAKFAVKAWYDECKDYDFVNGKYDDEHGHCTQVLWTTTTQVGCANVKCDNLVGGYVMVCSYYPAGNIVGDVDHQTPEDIKFFNAHLSPPIHH